MKGICKLCDQSTELQQSHIIPKFIFSWLKDTSATGTLRSGQKINRRVQDGIKLYLLCTSCEQRLSIWEKYFSEEIFSKLSSEESNIYYNENFLKFCVSISWRVMEHWISLDDVSDLDSGFQTQISKSIDTWKKYMLGIRGNPGEFEQHYFSFWGQIDFANLSVSKYINRYLNRAIDADVFMLNQTVALVYTKLPNLIIIGYISLPDKKNWRDSKINANHGVLHLQDQSTTFHAELWKHIQVRADYCLKLKNSMSDKQKSKIKESYRKLPTDKITSSETYKSLLKDINLFGEDNIFEYDD